MFDSKIDDFLNEFDFEPGYKKPTCVDGLYWVSIPENGDKMINKVIKATLKLNKYDYTTKGGPKGYYFKLL
jgi:hypothetical protein